MKKLLALVMSLVMVVGLAACGSNTDTPSTAPSSEQSGASSEAPASSEDQTGGEVTETYENQLVIGSTTQISSDMMEGWVNGAMNAGIYELLHGGLDTLQWTDEGEFALNPVVLNGDIASEEDEDGNRTYTVKINEGLVYNDGTPITAKDYVFELLLNNSDEMAAQDDPDTTGANRLVGWEEYNTGESDVFSGVRLLGDYEFSVTVAAENLPYHYEFTDMTFRPRAMHVIAPGCDIADDGEGAYMTGDWSAELLNTTLLDPDNGFRFNPKVTAGYYQFVSYDPSTSEAVLELNPNYPGTWDGHTPSIQKLILRLTTEETQMDELKAGTIDILSQMASGTEIEKGLDMVDEGLMEYIEFGRNGYGAVYFHCDFGPTQYEGVRRALAWLMNRDDFALTFTGGYGVTMDTYAGYGQKEYIENKDTLDKVLTHYTLDPEKAIGELEAAGFVLDSAGNDYDSSLGGANEGNIRHKLLDDGTLMPLTIEWCSTGNEVAQLLVAQLPAEASKVGMQVIETVVDFNTLLAHYYVEIDESERKYNMFNLASNMALTPAYWYYFSDNPSYVGTYNTERLYDDELIAVSDAMQYIPYDDEAAWNEAWIKLATRWNEVLPAVPLYSNLYYTFHHSKLENHLEHSTYQWYYGIVYSNIAGY